jgi:hypothetical protein
MNCRICGAAANPLFEAVIMDRYTVKYFRCDTCGFVQTEPPYWLEEAYKRPINLSDCGILARNLRFSKLVAPLLYVGFDHHAQFLDYAGGYGIFTRLMRDIGFDFYWHDPFTQNLFARGFECPDTVNSYEALTAFETLEHLAEPLNELEQMFALAPTIIFSTTLLPEPVPASHDWWYYGLSHGQHVSFYSLKTLQYIAHRRGASLYSNGIDFHMLTPKKISRLFFSALPFLSRYGLLSLLKHRMSGRTVDDMNAIIALGRIPHNA